MAEENKKVNGEGLPAEEAASAEKAPPEEETPQQAAPDEEAPPREKSPEPEKEHKKKDRKKGKEEQLQEEIGNLKDQLLRMAAEFDNYRKRSVKEKEAIYPQATADTVEKFLSVIDGFERALGCPCSDEAFKQGMELIYQNFLDILGKLQVEPIGKEGETFDPKIHNAVMHVEDETKGENVVAQVLQKGYRIGDRVVRYAMVQVAN